MQNSKKLYSPRQHQEEAINFAKKRTASILALDMGLGKTGAALLTLGDRGLVVCPPGLKYSWQDECPKWRTDLTPVVMEGLGLARFKWPSAGELVIVGYNQLPDWLEAPPYRCGFKSSDKSEKAKRARKKSKADKASFNKYMNSQAQYGAVTTVVFDECQSIKNNKASRSKRAKMLIALCKKTIALTGTPMPRGNPGDLYGILSTMRIQDDVFESYPNFLKLANYRPDSGKFGIVKPGFHEALKPFVFRKTKCEVAKDLPEKMFQTIAVKLNAKTQASLDGIPSEIVDGIKEAQTASQLTRLQHLPGFSEFAKCRKQIAQARIPALLEMLDLYEQEGIRTLVFSAHRDPIEALSERKGWEVIHGGIPSRDRQEVVRRQEQLSGIGITIKAGATGLNLQSFSNAIFVDLDWDITQNRQAEDRCHRLNSTGDFVRYVTLTSTHPIDRLITEKIQMASRNIDVAIEGME